MLEIAGVGIITAFLGGMISFLSPCVLPMVPGYVGYIGGVAIEPNSGPALRRGKLIALSLCFVLGFTTVFVLLGAGAGALSDILMNYRYEANLLGGALVILFGVLTAGLLKIPVLQRDWRWHAQMPGGAPAGAYAMGLAFALGWTPCIGPVLASVLTVAATQQGGDGVLLLTLYSLGLGTPFLLTAAFFDKLGPKLRGLGRLGRTLQIIAGGLMVVMGVAMITGRLGEFAGWLLQAFPLLARFG